MKFKNRNSLFIVLGLILIPTILGLIYLSTQKKTQTTTPRVSKPTTARITLPTKQPTPEPTTAQEILLERFDNRKQLAQKDIQAKQNILAKLPAGQVSGIVYETATIKIDYTQSADLIQVEILTREIQKAKEEAVTWLKSQGMSQEAICYAPVQFYPTFDLLQELKQKNIEFNPLAPGC